MRTGVAISDPERVIASPLRIVPSGDLRSYLYRLVNEQDVREVVVGVPRTLGGEVGYQARRILATLDALKRDFPGVRFVEWDERLTTRIAAAGSRRRRGSGSFPGWRRTTKALKPNWPRSAN